MGLTLPPLFSVAQRPAEQAAGNNPDLGKSQWAQKRPSALLCFCKAKAWSGVPGHTAEAYGCGQQQHKESQGLEHGSILLASDHNGVLALGDLTLDQRGTGPDTQLPVPGDFSPNRAVTHPLGFNKPVYAASIMLPKPC